MQGTSFVVSPIPDHTFFEQPVLKGGLCQGLLQRAGLSPQDLHFRAARLARRVTSKPLLAGLEKLFGPTVVQARRNPLAPAKLGYALLAAKALKHDADLFLRRMLFGNPPAGTV